MPVVDQTPPGGTFRRHAALFGYALMVVIASRLLLYGIGYLGLNLFPSYTERPAYDTSIQSGQSFERMRLPEKLSDTRMLHFSDLYKFDVYSYADIAENGYHQYKLDEPHPPANWVFFPLYPMMVKGLSYILPWWSIHTIGVLLSNLLLVVALYFVQLIALARGLVREEAGQLLVMIAVYPASLYFSLMYTESMFFCLSAATVYLALTKRYFWALLAAGLSTVTRVPGVANLLLAGGMLLIDLVMQRKWRFRWSDAKYMLYIGLSLLPLLSYFLYMQQLTGSFLAPVHEQDNWGRAEAIPFQGYLHYFREPYFILGGGGWDNGVITFVMATFALGIFAAYAIKHIRTLVRDYRELLFFAYGFMLIAIPFSSSPTLLTSIVRYMMVSIPLYFYLHDLTKRHGMVRQFALALMIMLNVVITVCFINNYFFVV
ncbi:MAG: hypothetical protein K0R57_3919 [Paenibacillaceae bacterium]|jgi:Gpi18-like mannosyltransferase|nr:hypothetical protein [Paenibacillaceae bacterium]